jgi:formate dehydrogenase alpha subunit
MQRASIESVCPYCGVGCGLYINTVAGKITGLDYMTEHPVNEGALCPKGNASLEIVYHHDRLLYPMQRVEGGFERIEWTEAFNLVAANINSIRAHFGPDALGFLASAKTTNEENYLFQKLARMLGTNNIDHCARLQYSPTVAGLVATLGSGAMTNPIIDLANADCIFVIGSNFAENHPIVSRWVLDAKQRGATIIVADPRFTPTAWSADLFLPVLPGSDTSLINAMMNVIIEEGLWNEEFIEERVEGYDELCDVVANYPPERVAKITRVPAEDIVKAARAYATAEASSIVYGMGVTRHTCGTETVKNLANLAMLTGQVGRPGTGVNPLRGQDNVQGACDMGALHNVYPGYQPVTDEANHEKFAKAYGMASEDMSRRPGLTLVEMTQAIEEGKLRGMLILGENPVVGDPNAAHVAGALKKLDFLAVIEIFPTETTELAHVVLPAASFAEKRGTKTATDRRVQWLERAVEPVGEAMADWRIICRLAARMGFEKQFTYPHEEAVFYEIRAMTPSYAGLSPERLQKTIGGIPWPCLATDDPGTPILYTKSFNRPDGKGKMIPVEYIPPAEAISEEYPLVLTSGRVELHSNADAMKRRTPALREREPELFVQINPRTAESFGIREQAEALVQTRRGEAKAKVRLTRRIPPGVLFVPFHFPEMNLLTNDALDPTAKIPEYKVAACRIRPVGKGDGHA